ncbi:MAG: hypothetical protein AAGA12_03850 [Pseudomonadota bacterium]
MRPRDLMPLCCAICLAVSIWFSPMGQMARASEPSKDLLAAASFVQRGLNAEDPGALLTALYLLDGLGLSTGNGLAFLRDEVVFLARGDSDIRAQIDRIGAAPQNTGGAVFVFSEVEETPADVAGYEVPESVTIFGFSPGRVPIGVRGGYAGDTRECLFERTAIAACQLPGPGLLTLEPIAVPDSSGPVFLIVTGGQWGGG